MLLAGTLLFIAALSGLSTLNSVLTGRGDDTVPDRVSDPAGHASGNRFGWQITAALLAGGMISALLGY